MPTAAGWTTLITALIAIGAGWLLGLVELLVLGAALVTAVAAALVVMGTGRSLPSVERTALPRALSMQPDDPTSPGRRAARTASAGERLVVELEISNRSRRPTVAVVISDHLGGVRTCAVATDRLRARQSVTVRRIGPILERGVHEIGPVTSERVDLLGLARTRRPVRGADRLVVVPRTVELTAPSIDRGPFGRQVTQRLHLLEPGDFRGLRNYVPGDEIRDIHWPSSAKRGTVQIRERERAQLERFIVILDVHHQPDPVAFEFAVSAAASLVITAESAGLVTRLASSDGLDLRDRPLSRIALEFLASIESARVGPIRLERDPGDGLGAMVIITATPDTAVWRHSERLLDPSLIRVGIFTGDGADAGSGPRANQLNIPAASLHRLARGWSSLMGTDDPHDAAGSAHR